MLLWPDAACFACEVEGGQIQGALGNKGLKFGPLAASHSPCCIPSSTGATRLQCSAAWRWMDQLSNRLQMGRPLQLVRSQQPTRRSRFLQQRPPQVSLSHA